MPQVTTNDPNMTPTDSVQMDQETKSVPRPESKRGRGCLWFSGVSVLFFLIVGACGLISFIFFLGSIGSTESTVLQEGSEDQIAIIDVEGVISRTGDVSFLGGVSGAIEEDIIYNIDSAVADPNVKAIILRIESPGGEAVASDIISRKVLEARISKPIVAYSSSMAASGGYMIASAADQFVVHPGTLTGSIGVIMQTSSMEGLYEKLGIETVTFKSDRFKDNEELFDEESEGEIETIYQELVDESYEQFLEIIMLGRGMNEVHLRQLADGRLYSGTQAVENGLADSEGYFEDAVEVAENMAGISDATLVEYSNYSVWGGLFGASLLQKVLPFVEGNQPLVGVYYLPDLSR